MVLKKKTFNLKQGINEIVNSVKQLMKIGKRVIVVGIAGGSGSGKGYAAVFVSRATGGKIIRTDDYYIGIEKMEDRNFDKPSAFDWSLLKKHLRLLKEKKKIKKPVYDFVTHRRVGYEDFLPSQVIILEGLFVLNKSLRDELSLKIFIEAPEKLRLQRRMSRDIKERGRTKESIIQQWRQTVKPMHEKFVAPQKKYADLILINK